MGPCTETMNKQKTITLDSTSEMKTNVPVRIVWKNVVLFTYLHLAALYGLYLCFHVKYLTILWTILLYMASGIGITAGAHRLWSHRAYKARLPLRIILAIFNGIAFQNHIFEWARDHRVHHKYSETDADPHNAKRGFFFSHIGWLLSRKHPEVITKGNTIDVSDLLADPVVYYQKKFYMPLVLIMCFILPAYISFALWGETIWNGLFVCAALRYLTLLHSTWLVNSAAHMWGDRPYDRTINSAENLMVAVCALGEGHHNYHHTFPWDYAASEWGWKVNISTFFIDMCAMVGLAYDLKQVPKEIVAKRRLHNGDDSTPWYDKKSFETHLSKGL